MSDRQLRRVLLLVMASLISLGCVMVYSATAIMAHETYGNRWHFVLSHVVAILVGVSAGLGCLAIPSSVLRRSIKPILGISLLLLVLVMVCGSEVGGARRWFRLGRFGVQPSEFAQIALVLYLSDFLARKPHLIRQFRDGLLPPLLVIGTMAGLVLLQPDLGTTIVMGAVTIVLLIMAKASWRHLGLTMGIGAMGLVLLIGMEAYRVRRLLAFLDPWSDPQGAGFQILQSYLAIANGGLLGQGLGASMQKLFYLPGIHTDFLFALVAEELGLIGTTAVLSLFALFVLCGIRLAMRVEDPFRKYLICGCVALISLEALVNMAVVTGLLPTKGLPLPLVSYGGTAMVSNCLACALIVHASRQRVASGELPVTSSS